MSTDINRIDNDAMVLAHKGAGNITADDAGYASYDQLQAAHGNIVHTTRTKSLMSRENYDTVIRGLTPTHARELAKALVEMADRADAMQGG